MTNLNKYTMNLEQRFKKETGFDAYKDNDLEPKIPLGYYVEWLEEQLILSGVVGQSEQLKRDTFIKSREETARAREASAIKQTLEIYCSHDELPTVNEVLERIGRKH